ncbi:MAG TPA: sigma-E factor negative regulatory protein [Burkholderiales bacterium]|nr:sigma-E factor negative regulatory protein [Burkholderiales bacterium]
MKHDISALMDGELDRDAAKAVIAMLGRHKELRETWFHYHLIGDVMRQTGSVSYDFGERFKEKLAVEPVILAPRRTPLIKTKITALSIAASLAAAAMVAWVVLQNNTDKAKENIAANQQPNAAVMLANLPRYPFNSNVNEYLLAHQEFSPSTMIQGVAPYVRTVSDEAGEAGR